MNHLSSTIQFAILEAMLNGSQVAAVEPILNKQTIPSFIRTRPLNS